MLVGTAARQSECAALFVEIDIIASLIQLLTCKFSRIRFGPLWSCFQSNLQISINVTTHQLNLKIESSRIILTAKQEDDEIVLQIMFAVHVMLRHETIRPQLVKNSRKSQ